MSYYLRLLSIPILAAVLFASTSCGPATVTVGNDGYYDNQYYYGARRLPLDYFYYNDYYDGMQYQDYVVYGDYWYYHGEDTPYYDDPYVW